MEWCPCSFCKLCEYFRDPWVSFPMVDEFSVKVSTNYQKDNSLIQSQPAILIAPDF